jgi:hypothetical protein
VDIFAVMRELKLLAGRVYDEWILISGTIGAQFQKQ